MRGTYLVVVAAAVAGVLLGTQVSELASEHAWLGIVFSVVVAVAFIVSTLALLVIALLFVEHGLRIGLVMGWPTWRQHWCDFEFDPMLELQGRGSPTWNARERAFMERTWQRTDDALERAAKRDGQ